MQELQDMFKHLFPYSLARDICLDHYLKICMVTTD
uniref:Uncharacterized protein n=1 Tax=Arundo donax TaxID=35708 RepID=A0A0A8XXR9_ARUDO